MYTTATRVLKPYIRNSMPAGGLAPLLEHLALPGRSDADFHGFPTSPYHNSANFASTEF